MKTETKYDTCPKCGILYDKNSDKIAIQIVGMCNSCYEEDLILKSIELSNQYYLRVPFGGVYSKTSTGLALTLMPETINPPKWKEFIFNSNEIDELGEWFWTCAKLIEEEGEN